MEGCSCRGSLSLHDEAFSMTGLLEIEPVCHFRSKDASPNPCQVKGQFPSSSIDLYSAKEELWQQKAEVCLFHCIIDSTFVIDSCGVLANELKPISVNKAKTKITSVYLDSLLFSGVTYRNVYCLVADLAGWNIKNFRILAFEN